MAKDIKTIAEECSELGYFPNYYEILGLKDFSPHDTNARSDRMTKARDQILDKHLLKTFQKFVNEADTILKNPATKKQYDVKLQQHLDKSANAQGGVSVSYGMPKLGVDGFNVQDGRLVLEEMRPNIKIPTKIDIKNVANTGILNATVSVPHTTKWLNIDTNRITQNELHKPLTVTVDTSHESFSSGSNSSSIEFVYQTDKGQKKFTLPVVVTLEGLLKKTKRILKFSNIGFGIIYGILMLTLLNTGAFSDNSFITKILVFFSIGFLGYTLYHMSKANDFSEFYERGRNRWTWGGVGLLIIFFGNFQAFLLFMIPVSVAFALRYMAKNSIMPEFIKYVPLLGLLFFTFIFLSSGTFRDSIFSSSIASPPLQQEQISPAQKTPVVVLKTDVNLRDQPNPQAGLIGKGLGGNKYEIVEFSPNSSWQKVKVGEQIGYMFINDQTGTIVIE
ncbi:hypothetical protein [Flavilitoribacter nigricans]|uniref:SH3b domain-containing protein n=1 Tax=Flavilitoribacter nigricans (strain ATCC 23147 / DSM 23189 / NBRC 102662 / NCIMB 1420 / SS-2) TaxID=1122177 RepID=A0A2D0MX50_FLAN2|nr:hypothetical protein [Flavilitoribacter nigricans]PHN00728.1 hypothetical protein CRP01_40810 [Flavilitoribacter nigricans DSM 23189 = NBRC 102662]